MLQTLHVESGATAPQVAPDPPRTCEACGRVVSDGSKAMNIMMQIGVGGDPRISPFQCPFTEHWACSLDCWRAVAHACIEEHMHAVLKGLHDNLGKEDTAQ